MEASARRNPIPEISTGYWVEPEPGVYGRIDPYRVEFELVLIPHVRKWTWGCGLIMVQMSFPEFFQQDRDGRPRGLIQLVKAGRR